MSTNLNELREVTGDELRTVEGGQNDNAAMFQMILQQLTGGYPPTVTTEPTLIHERPHAK